MARMTDIDELLEKVAKIQASGGSQEKRVGEIILAITNAPTVEVVRCKDCKHYHADTLSCDFTPFSKYYERPNWYEDDFCSYGERGDGNGEKE